ESLAVVNDDRGEPGQVGYFGDAFRYVSGAENEQARLRHNWLDEDAQLASTNQPIVIGGVLAQAEVHLPRPFGFHDFARGIPYFRFDAAAPDCAQHGPVLAHQQLRAFVARNGSVDLDDSS